MAGIVAIAAGFSFTLFLKNDGTVYAYGDNNTSQLGDGTGVMKTSPVQVPGLTNVVAIAAGYYHLLFCMSGGTVWACGMNDDGQLGDNTFASRSSPCRC